MSHKLLAKQLAKARNSEGRLDIDAFLDLVGKAYEEADADRRRTQRSISLMIEELDRLNSRDREQLMTQLKVQNARFVAALENMSHALAMFDADRRLIVCNRPYAEMYRLTPELARPGALQRDILARRVAMGAHPPGDPERHIADAIESTNSRTPWTKIDELEDGRVISVSFRPMPEGGWVTTHLDITEQKRAEARISHMARHDPLTDLPNRLLLRETLTDSLRWAQPQMPVAVLSVDLDHFKAVNDTFGHSIGDDLLVAVSERLRGCVRGGDVVARLGGDEFVVVQFGGTQPQAATALAERLIEALGTPFEIRGQHIVIGTSVGAAVAPGDGTDPDQLVRSADIALYRAKSEGRGAVRFFEAAMDANIKERRLLEVDLRRALRREQFEVHYQPIVALAGGAVTGIEALVRWNHPRRGRVMPQEFIQLAEEIGLIAQIGEWVLRQACRDAVTWPDDLPVAVNLSPVQFRGRRGLLPVVAAALAESGLDPRRLMLEITETLMMQENEATLDALHQMRALGIRIVMDDFGTGYSSLGYLRRFPFDKIKIDRSFVADFPKAESAAIIRAVSGLGAGLGMVTTAEGVETEEQLRMLREQGCREGQGFLFSPPLPAAQLASYLAARRPAIRSVA